MAEYIERETLLKRLCDMCENEYCKAQKVKRGAEYSECIEFDLIRSEPAADVAPVRKWISVKDRLPEEEGLYLVAVVNDHERRYSKTAWYHGHGNWFLHQKVTNWMPLPEPPKGE